MPRQNLFAAIIFSFFISLSFLVPACDFAQAEDMGGNSAQMAEPGPERMLGAMLMLGFRGASAAEAPDFIKMISAGQVGNVILFDRDVTAGTARNIHSPTQLKTLAKALRDAAPAPMFIAVDQEGGQVRRLKTARGFMDLPSAQRMGQGNPHATMETADQLGREMREAGINMDLAPVVDVDVNPYNPLIGRLGRSFNTDPHIVARHALSFGLGLAKNGVTPTLKHFPGQGCAEKDSHLGPTDISQCWNPDVDLLPYAEIFRAGWPGAVMIGHLQLNGLDPDLPATLSKNIVTGLLREGMGWHGVVISDDLQMKAVLEGRELKEVMRLAVEAGVDILLLGNNLEWDPELPRKAWENMLALHQEGAITKERLLESWRRIRALHDAYAGSAPQPPSAQ